MNKGKKDKEVNGLKFHFDSVHRLVEKHFKVIRNSDDKKEPYYFLSALIRAVAVTSGVHELNDKQWDATVQYIVDSLNDLREKSKRVVGDESNT